MDNNSGRGNNFDDIMKFGVYSQPDSSQNILEMLAKAPVKDVGPMDALSAATGMQSVQDNQAKILRNRYDLAADFPFLTPSLQEFQAGSVGKDENYAQNFLNMLQQGRRVPSGLEEQAKTSGTIARNKALLDQLMGQQGGSTSATSSSAPVQSYTDPVVIDADGNELTGQEAHDYLAGHMQKTDAKSAGAQASKGDTTAMPPAIANAQAYTQSQSLGLKPKIQVDTDGNMKMSFDAGDGAGGVDLKEEAQIKKAQRDVGNDPQYFSNVFPGYSYDKNTALKDFSPRIQKELNQQVGTAQNVLGNIQELKSFIRKHGVPVNPMTSEYKQFGILYNNALAGVMDTMGGASNATEDSSGIIPWSNSKKKLASNILPDPRGITGALRGTDAVLSELDLAASTVQGDLDSALGAYGFKPKKAVKIMPDGSVYSFDYRDRDAALNYLDPKGSSIKPPSSLKKTKEGSGAAVPSAQVPIHDADGNMLGTTSAANLERDKAALRAQGHKVL